MPPSILDHRLLRQFLAVADAGSLRGAAAALHISQPPLTQAIRRLEDGLGVSLFERVPKGMVLTGPGRELAEEARQLLARIDRAERRVVAAAQAEVSLTIGFVSAALNGALTDCLQRLAAHGYERPGLQEMTTPAQHEALADGRIDLGLLHPPVEIEDLAVRSLGRDPFVAAIPADWSMAKRRSVKFRDVASLPLVLFPPAQGPSLMGAIDRMAFEAGRTIDVAAEAPRTHSQLAIVASGLGIGLVTRSTSRTLRFAGVSYVPISDTRDRLYLELVLVGREDLVDVLNGMNGKRG